MTTTTCTSHLIGGSVDDAAAGFSRLVRDRGGLVRITADGGELVVDRMEGERVARGTLRVGSFRRVAVSIELFPWSHSEAELTVRPAGNRAPFGNVEAYLDVASDAARRLAELIDRRVRLADLAA